MVLTRNQADSSAKLLAAILSGDRSRLTAQLASASPAALAVTEPLSVFHAAALVGDAEAVRLLAAAGAPVAAAGQLSTLGFLFEDPSLFGVALTYEQCFAIAGHISALHVAANMEHVAVVSALLELGVDPDASVPGKATPLAVVAEGGLRLREGRGPPFGGQGAALVQQLLAAGADVTRCPTWSVYLCASRQPEAARILLAHLRQASEAGRFEMPAAAHNAQPLLQAASMVDDLGALEHFAARLQLQHATQDLAHQLLHSAAGAGSLQVVGLALQAAAVPDGQQTTAAGQLLGPHVEAAMPKIVCSAAFSDHATMLQQLLAVGYAADNHAVRCAVQGGSIAALRLLLRHGALPIPGDPPGGPDGPVDLPSAYIYQYSCPILTALQTHHTHFGWQERVPDRAAQPWDTKILPVLELLLDAGYRPATYENVLVYPPGGEVELRQHFDPLADDAGLIQDDINRWLALAIQHPAWSPSVHHRFLPSFQAAARALLLVAHRGGRRRSSRAAAGLASLPQGVLLHSIGLAAYPLSAWVALDAGGPEE